MKIEKAKPKTHLSVLAFGEPGTRKSTFALTFPSVLVVDTHGSLDAAQAPAGARIVRSNDPSVVSQLIDTLAKDPQSAQAFSVDGISRLLDEIQVGAEGSGARYYAAVRKRLIDLTDAARKLPMHVVFTARSKDQWAKTGDVISHYTVSPEDKVVVGSEPDVDRALRYDVDLVLEMTVDSAGVGHARVVSSHLRWLPVGMTVDDPNAEKILTLAGLGAEKVAAPAAKIPDNLGDRAIMKLFVERNRLLGQKTGKITNYMRLTMGLAHVKAPSDVTLADRAATRNRLTAEIAAAKSKHASEITGADKPALRAA